MIREFDLQETCNTYIQLLKKEIESKNVLRLSLDVQLPNKLLGDQTGLCNSIVRICTFLMQQFTDDIDVEIQKTGQRNRSIYIIVKIKALYSDETDKEALQITSKDMDWLSDMPYKTSFWILPDYLQFSFRMTFQYINEEQGDVSSSFLNSKILLAEGNRMNARVLISYLEEWGCSVTQVNTAVEAIAVAAVSKFDLIILDIYMPEINGLHIVQNIRLLNPKTPITILAPSSPERDINDPLLSDANELLLKPIDKRQLFGILAKHL